MGKLKPYINLIADDDIRVNHGILADPAILA